jgi:hypothetical protein
MSTTQTMPPPPTTQNSNLSPSDHQWLLIVQNLLPLVLVDSTSGPVSIALPPPGVSSSGQTGQGKEIIYKKISADSNLVSITGGAEGTQTFSMQYAGLRFKSDGTDWWVVGALP